MFLFTMKLAVSRSLFRRSGQFLEHIRFCSLSRRLRTPSSYNYRCKYHHLIVITYVRYSYYWLLSCAEQSLPPPQHVTSSFATPTSSNKYDIMASVQYANVYAVHICMTCVTVKAALAKTDIYSYAPIMYFSV